MKALTSDVVLRTTVELFGVKRAAVLFGYALVVGAVAPATANRRWIAEHGPMGMATRYRRLGEFDRLREELERRGYEVDRGDAGDVAAVLRLAA